MSRNDEQHRARAQQSLRQGPAESIEVVVSRMVERRTRELERKIEALERRVAVLEGAA